MSLKDATAYNVQFIGYRPVFIDTLSFERYEEGMPWVAYRQFCQHFLAPLALMSYTDIRMNQLARIHISRAGCCHSRQSFVSRSLHIFMCMRNTNGGTRAARKNRPLGP